MPKSGCTTIKNVLHRLDGGAFIADPLTIHKRKDLLVRADREPEEIARRLGRDPVFTFVRHPLRRAYSCFSEKMHFQTPYSFPRVRATIAADYGGRFETAPSAELHRENFKAFLRFARDSFEGRNAWRRDPHWCPQTMVLAERPPLARVRLRRPGRAVRRAPGSRSASPGSPSTSRCRG